MAKDSGKSRSQKSSSDDEVSTPQTPSTRVLVILGVLGAVSAMWAVFLWGELLVARSGGTTFCELGGKASCSQLWDGAFASQVHALTKIPVAGWGVIWGALAMVLPLGAIIRRDEGASATAYVTATRILGAVGAATVLGLLGVSAMAGSICIGCIGTYIITGLYAVVSLYVLREEGFDDVGGALKVSAIGAVAVAALLVYPGSETPQSSASQQKDVLKAAANTTASTSNTNSAHKTPKTTSQNTTPPQKTTPHSTTTAPKKPMPPQHPGAVTDRLRQFFSSIAPPMQQGISDSLNMYRESKVFPMDTPRVVMGGEAKLTIMEWTDVRCGHCAQLHEALEEIHKVVPANSFSVVPRHFPLDGACNSGIQRVSPDGVSCLAAKAQICMEPLGDKLFEYSGKLFKNQQSLTQAMVFDLAKPYMPEAELRACINSAATEAKLKSDVAAALTTNPEGTPVVLINGKKGSGFGAFLFAIIVAGGNPDEPAFAMLPPPDKNAHVH